MDQEGAERECLLQQLLDTKQTLAEAWRKEMQRRAREEQEGGLARPSAEMPKEVAKPPEQGEGERPLENRPPE
eukprot:11283567-Heterocapsa_arctica.AAC.1